MKNLTIRTALPADTALILSFIKELAEYEKMLDLVIADEKTLHEHIFTKARAEAIILEEDGLPVGYSLFFHNFSTFLGRSGIYIEDIYVSPAFRGKGYGKAVFAYLAKLAQARDCGRIEWACLDWNAPSISFYKSLGAVCMDEWKIFRLDAEQIEKMNNI